MLAPLAVRKTKVSPGRINFPADFFEKGQSCEYQ